MFAVIVFVIILGVLIFVHELGHFVTARRNGIKAEEFGFGFPPRAVGVQFISGEKKQKTMEVESVEVEKIVVENGEEEIRKEIITEKLRRIFQKVKFGRWRFIWGSEDGDNENEKKDLTEAHEKKMVGGTIYSLNWIPLGGFVKIKGEDGGNKKDEDSFAGKSAWTRIKVLAAGVMMNFILAWVLISLVFMIGAPQAVESNQASATSSKIQISDVSKDSPAEKAGIEVGDEILKNQTENGNKITLNSVEEVQNFVNANKGREIILAVKRGKEILEVKITPRLDAPEGQGATGVMLAETIMVRYLWYKAIWEGLKTVLNLVAAIFLALVGIVKNIFMGNGAGVDVAGPVGIAVLTKSVTGLGLVYVLQFAAYLSINLGIINILPIPALDGGRILFIFIEKIKGRPVSKKVEQIFHSVGFALLIGLLALVTFKDVLRYWK